MAKEMVYSDNARLELLKGVNAVADAVRVTMGPKGRNATIKKANGDTVIINDGVSIAKEIDLDNEIQDMGAQLVKDVSSKTNEAVGDGTTLSCVLTQALVKEGIKMVTVGCNPIQLRQGMSKAVKDVVALISANSKKVETPEQVAQVATVSAGNDEEVGKLVAEAMQKVGNEGIVTVSESKSAETNLKVVEGMQFPRGFLSPYFITNAERGEAVLEDALVLLYSGKISNIKNLVPLLETVARSGNGQPILIVADSIEGEGLSTLVVNHLRKVVRVCAVNAPEYGDRRISAMQDIAVLTGAKYIDANAGQLLEQVTLEDLGHAKQVIVRKDNTIIITENKEENEPLKKRISQLKKALELGKFANSWEEQQIKERIMKLDGVAATIEVGAGSEIEIKEKKLRIEDALNATKAAIAEGIVPGGGTSLVKIANVLGKTNVDLTADAKAGYKIVLDALVAPVTQIANNAGRKGDVIAYVVGSNTNFNEGYDALNDAYVDMIKEGIVDPAKVVRSALENAASVSASLLTTEVAIVPKKEKEPAGIALQMPAMGM